MSNCKKRSSQDTNCYLANPQLGMSQYPSSGNSHYVYNGHNQYGLPQSSFHTYSSPFLPSQSQQSPYTSEATNANPLYQMTQPAFTPAPPQQQLLPHGYQFSQQSTLQPQYPQTHRFIPRRETHQASDIENQESCNEDTMMSEPVVPPLEGFPDVKEFDQLMKSYVDDLSVKKQDKALIHAARARNIKTVLIDPKDTAIESAQFRFWVKKMFKLQPNDGTIPDRKKKICHDGKPVAVREKLFKILTKAHQQCQHGGRDKTSAQVRRIYSWVPKELISRFVKICPNCQVRRGGSRLTPPNSRRSSPQTGATSSSPMMLSPPESRRDSMMTRSSNALSRPPSQQRNSFTTHLQGQNLWMTPPQHMSGQVTNMDAMTSATMDALTYSKPTSVDHISAGLPNAMDPNQLDFGTHQY